MGFPRLLLLGIIGLSGKPRYFAHLAKSPPFCLHRLISPISLITFFACIGTFRSLPFLPASAHFAHFDPPDLHTLLKSTCLLPPTSSVCLNAPIARMAFSIPFIDS